MQRGTNGTLAGIKLFHHALNLSAQASLVEVDTKDVLAAVERLQAAPVLIGLADFEGSNDGLQLSKHGVR